MQQHTIYTAGYNRWTIQQLDDEAKRRGAVILDIRYNPTSMRPEWQKHALFQRFGPDRYMPLPALGNRNYRGGEIELAAPLQALPHVQRHLFFRSIILLCACPDYRTCHRLVAAEWLAERIDAPVEHLEPPALTVPDGSVAVLTVRQPWAWAMFHAGKDVENRDWRVDYRGKLYIHTSQRVTRYEFDDARNEITRISNYMPPSYKELPHGAIIGSVEATDCVEDSDSPWFFGEYGLLIKNATLLPAPIPVKGALKVWTWQPPEGVTL